MRKTNNLFICLLFVAVLLFSTIVSQFACNNITHAESNYVAAFLNAYNIKSNSITKKDLCDFAGNRYELYEFGEKGYAIFDSKTKIMLEGSKKAASPYLNDMKNLYYLGVGNYYVANDEKVLDLENGKTFDLKEAHKNAYSVSLNEQYINNSKSIKKANSLKTVGNDYIYLENHSYFENLAQFPVNNDNSCGVTALAIVLGYYDNYFNDNFVNDEYMVKRVLEVNSLSEVGDWYPSVGTNNSFGTFIKNSDYIHYVPNISNAYPMTHIEIKNTIEDYINGECSDEIKNNHSHSYGTITNTHSHPRTLISNGWPVILTLTRYNNGDTIEYTRWHDVVAYGYNENRDEFVVHMGHAGEYEYVLSTYTVMGYYSLIYTGAHKHSKNNIIRHHYKVFRKKYVSTLGLCGCGTTTIISIDKE